MKRTTFACCLLASLLVIGSPALAAPVAEVSLGTVQVEWQPTAEFAGMKLRVSGPLGVVEREFAAGENPLFDLRTLEAVADGLYTWELVAAPRLEEGVRRTMAEARAEGDEGAQGRLRASGDLPAAGSLVQSGHFTVAAGAILVPDGAPEQAAPATLRRVTSDASSGDARRVSAADQVIPDDLIVQGSLCVGFDCVNNESFGFDTIRLKENNTRVKFEDTSAGTFPSNDWQLTANDSASGGANKFSIEDITGARVPFTVTAGAASNSIFVDSTGRVGFRTSTPVLDLHVATGNTPGLRLEQNSSGGFTAQTWDVAGNEANFFIRSVTTGSQLPFRIRPGAPTSSIDIAASGNVGIGTASPQSKLHVEEGDVLIRANTNPGFTLQDDDGTGASTWVAELNANGLFQISKNGTGGAEVLIRDRLDPGGLETMDVDGSIEATAFNISSSRTYKQDFAPVDGRDVLERVVALPVSRWTFKWDQNATPHIGPMAEDFAELFAVGNDPSNISLTDASGVALAAIQGLYQELQEKERENAALRARQEALESRLAEIEARLAPTP